ncbi:MAG: DEAD/DEAH box helicase [Desulfurococcaceae archaeon]|nr:DEAD/DEAH box helicase [Desulfurococcaceae archaeon]
MSDVELSEIIIKGLRERDYTNFTPPQLEALKTGFLKGENLVVCAPTASGKTLIGEIALVSAVLRGLKGIYTSPLKALAYEKFEEFSFWSRYGVKVGVSMGDYEVTEDEIKRLSNYDIIVTTYERLDSILRRRPFWVKSTGVIVIDELHMLGDESRGHIVEMIATRAKLLGIQVVGLSATIGNAEEIAKWLGAKLVKSSWRPVKLYEVPSYRASDGKYIMFLPQELGLGSSTIVINDITKYWIDMALRDGFNVLEFKYSRRGVEELAEQYSLYVCSKLSEDDKALLKKLLSEMRLELPDFEYEKLEHLVKCGVAFHHAGLSPEARRFIEKAFRDRYIKYLAATPTLAMGVNLPARVVIINAYYYSGGGREKISVLEYKQLSGRAGRPQYDPYGIVIVVKDARSLKEAEYYMKSPPEPITSTLLSEAALRRHVLAVIASQEANKLSDIVKFFSSTFAAMKMGEKVLEKKIIQVLDLLEELNMVKSRAFNEMRVFTSTRLGIATTMLYIDPLTTALIVEGLRRVQKASELYYLALIGMSPDFADVNIGRGVRRAQEELVESYSASGLLPDNELEYIFSDPKVDWVRGAVIGMVLRDWIDEVPERRILESYGIEAGDLRVIKETGEWLTYATAVIAQTLSMQDHASTLFKLLERVKHGVREDALELVKIRYVGRVRARTMISHGIKSVSDVIAKESLIRRLFGDGWGEKIVAEAKKVNSRNT